MNDNAKQWVAALRSGEYEQGNNVLCNLQNKYCCLGVACRLYQDEVGGLKITKCSEGFQFNKMTGVLPIEVEKWLGLNTVTGYFSNFTSLIILNDRGDTFDEIADVIESEPKGLFVK